MMQSVRSLQLFINERNKIKIKLFVLLLRNVSRGYRFQIKGITDKENEKNGTEICETTVCQLKSSDKSKIAYCISIEQ